MGSAYLTIAGPAEGIYREKMSRFLAFAFPVTTADEAKATVKRVANEYHDARHACWGYILGADGHEYLSSDNGEPSGTAGRPILGAIRSAGLTNVLVVVVRYFGGIKLGTSGLIVAYKEAARLALEAAEKVEAHEMSTLTFAFPYQSMNPVMQLLKATPSATIIEQQFDNTCSITITLPADDSPALASRLTAISGLSLQPL